MNTFMRMLAAAPITRNLLIINIVAFVGVSLMSIPMTMRVDDLFALHYFDSPGFRVWQLLTYMFMHANFTHLFFNMFALAMFGPELEWRMGHRRFLFFYLACGVGAALIQEGVFAIMLLKYQNMFGIDIYDLVVNGSWKVMHGYEVPLTLSQAELVNTPAGAELAALVNGSTVGASGAIFGLLLAFAVINPNRDMYIMFIPVPVKAKWVVLGYGVIELAQGVGGFETNVAHFAHLGGMFVGLLIILFWKYHDGQRIGRRWKL